MSTAERERRTVGEDTVEAVREAIEERGRAYVKTANIRDDVDAGGTRIALALAALADDGYLELYRDNTGPKLYRVVGGGD